MSDTLNMPKDFGKLCEQYAFHDIKEIYTNGSELIQTYRVEQWIEKNGIKEAMEKQATSNYTSEWIPVSERLPENIKTVLVTLKEMEQPTIGWYGNIDGWRLSEKEFCCIEHEVIAWMPCPEPYKGE